MRQRLAKWMMGRNGMDALNRLLSVLTLIVLIVSMFVHGYAARILWSLAVVGLIILYFRMLSRNVYRRQQENGAYLRQKYKITSAWRGGKPEAQPYVRICDRKSGGADAGAEGSL